jgi:tetratricopeptide (TPR) repeat protein
LWRQRHRGFESHALRSDLGKLVLTWAYARLPDVAGSSPTAARCSRLPLFAAGRGIYAGWILKRFPRSTNGKQEGPADRAGFCAERAGSPLAVAASMFRMAHVFLALGQIDQAHHVATSTAQALEPKVTPDAEPEVLSLYGALHQVLAVAAARDNKRGEAHQHLETARNIAGQLGEDRDDYGTEFGLTNVAIHAVNIAVELGDAGQAIELGQHVTPANLSPERQARYWLDLAQAHAMRRQIGEALHALQEAERIAPEETRIHYVGRAVTRDLLQLSGLRPRPELRDLAERFGVLP